SPPRPGVGASRALPTRPKEPSRGGNRGCNKARSGKSQRPADARELPSALRQRCHGLRVPRGDHLDQMTRLRSLAVMRAVCVRLALFVLEPLAAAGCGKERDDPDAAMAQGGITVNATGGDDGIDDGIDDGDDGGEKLDAQAGETEGAVPCAEGGDCDECVEYEHVPCDSGTDDLVTAMGLNCPGEATVTAAT